MLPGTSSTQKVTLMQWTSAVKGGGEEGEDLPVIGVTMRGAILHTGGL